MFRLYHGKYFFASCGKYVNCFEKPSSVYRIGSSGSWSSLHDSNFNAYMIREKKMYEKKL